MTLGLDFATAAIAGDRVSLRAAPHPMKLLLRNHQSPGDVLMLTAAVRDLHRAHPSRFVTAVETHCPALWENNPWVVLPNALGHPDRVIECAYPLVHESNRRPFHFIHGFAQDLERQLGIPVPVSDFRGDVHLSPHERGTPTPVETAGYHGRYWVVVAGGKLDFTTKWWPAEYFQAVVDHFAGRMQFVQCGSAEDRHPPLRRVISLVGRTSLREFVRVVHHADGVLCPVPFAMHLAAAVPPAAGRPPLRPCVVVAGGREPSHWEMYSNHQFLHTVGTLDCCATGGCWRSRCQPVGDGDSNDFNLCARPRRVGQDAPLVAQCMAMVTPGRVIDAIELYCSARSEPVRTTITFPEGETLVGSRSCTPAKAVVEHEVIVRPNGVAVTIGTGAFESMAHLAAREVRAHTGLDTVVLGPDAYAASGLPHPALLKFRIFDLVKAEHVLFFDADQVCLARWDPRRYFGQQAIVAVRERMLDAIRGEAEAWGVPHEEYFNSGMFIASAEHHRPWLRLGESLYPPGGTVLQDQSPLNAARHRLGIPVRFLDRRYNWLGFGGNSLSLDVPVVMAHKLVPNRVEVNTDYLEGRYDLFTPNVLVDDSEASRLAGRSFIIQREGVSDQTVHFREDGTILPLADPDEPGYWFVHIRDQRPTLALASEDRVTHEFVELLGGSWVSSGTDCWRLVDEAQHCEPPLTAETARPTADRFVRVLGPYPADRYHGCGIVICGGGPRYLPCAWVCIRMLRYLGCDLPIELWHLRQSEGDARLDAALADLNVRCMSAAEVRRRHPVRYLGGWELKPYAILHSAFEQVLYLDADNVPVRDPSFLFETRPFADAGAVFWPDYGRLPTDADVWRVCGVPYRDEPAFESGQVLVDKRRCWRPLNLTMHLNEHSDFYYRLVHGDKDTFHLAWRILGQGYAMVPHPIQTLFGTMCQHDFDGRRLFQHRNLPKWTLRRDENPHVDGFEFEGECLRFLGELRDLLGVGRA